MLDLEVRASGLHVRGRREQPGNVERTPDEHVREAVAVAGDEVRGEGEEEHEPAVVRDAHVAAAAVPGLAIRVGIGPPLNITGPVRATGFAHEDLRPVQSSSLASPELVFVASLGGTETFEMLEVEYI
jgi:hypothetical protein